VQEVVQRLATTASLGDDVIGVTDGYAWFLKLSQTIEEGTGVSWKDSQAARIVFPTHTSLAASAETADGFTALCARQLILGLSRRVNMSALENLDAIHLLAKTYRIVSPYSSMIVLVNERQKEELKEAEAQTDRFEREVESGHEVLEEPHNPLNSPGGETSVPEPDTILLAGVAVSVLGWLAFRRRRQCHR